jgi:S-adenosylmethionine/arginine decarboxylase-like enzyme
MFGKHLIFDCNECKGEIKKKEHIQKFIDDLIDLCQMKKMKESLFIEFESNEYNNSRDITGWTILTCISLSNITIHINFISKTIYFELFTCGDLNETLIINLFNFYFKPTTTKKIILNRDARDLYLPFVAPNDF